MKGQVFEVMGFVMLAIAIIAVIILLRTTSIGSFGKTILTLAERHESEGVRAGANALFSMTDSKSGKTIQELVGIAAFIGNDTIDFGPTVGQIDVPQEITWRLDSLYGKDHWFMSVPYPKIDAPIQVVYIVDVSASMCSKVQTMTKTLPLVIDTLRRAGKRVTATIYMLHGGAPCCGIEGYSDQPYKISCDKFPQNQYLRCASMPDNACPDKLQASTEEDWGHGTACAVEVGPIEGWQQFSVRVIIPVSDEVSQDSECGHDPQGDCGCSLDSSGHCTIPDQSCYADQYQGILRGIEVAKNGHAFIFPINAETGKACCPDCVNCPGNCNHFCAYYGGEQYSAVLTAQCHCHDLLTRFMTEMATATRGKVYDLSSGTDIAGSLNDVIKQVTPERTGALEAGNKQGYQLAQATKNIRAVNFPIPVAVAGIYTNANIYEWS